METVIETRSSPKAAAKRSALPLRTSMARQIAAHTDVFALAHELCLARLRGALPDRPGHTKLHG